MIFLMMIMISINPIVLVTQIFFAKALSKSSSIKSGEKLNSNEQEFLVNQLFSCKEPNLSPFNKQIFITLSKNDIENIF